MHENRFEVAKSLRAAQLTTPSLLSDEAVAAVGRSLSVLLADVFALYIKTKNFHWHMSGPRFRDYHLMLDEHSDQVFAMTDVLAERGRKIGAPTIRSVGHIARLQRLPDNDAEFVTPQDMLSELRDDNRQLAAEMRQTHALCGRHGDFASASILETYLDETERRIWFLFEMTRTGAETPTGQRTMNDTRANRLEGSGDRGADSRGMRDPMTPGWSAVDEASDESFPASDPPAY